MEDVDDLIEEEKLCLSAAWHNRDDHEFSCSNFLDILGFELTRYCFDASDGTDAADKLIAEFMKELKYAVCVAEHVPSDGYIQHTIGLFEKMDGGPCFDQLYKFGCRLRETGQRYISETQQQYCLCAIALELWNRAASAINSSLECATYVREVEIEKVEAETRDLSVIAGAEVVPDFMYAKTLSQPVGYLHEEQDHADFSNDQPS